MEIPFRKNTSANNRKIGEFKSAILHDEKEGHQTLHEKLVKIGISVFYITF